MSPGKVIRRLKILMVIAVFHPYIGGAEKQAQKLASELIDRGMEVTVVTGRWNNALKRCERLNNIKIFRNLTNLNLLNKSRLDTKISVFDIKSMEKNKRIDHIRIFFKKISIRLSIYIYQISLFIFLLVNRKRFDILHVHQVLFPAFISSLCGVLFKKPVIAKVGNTGLRSDIKQIKELPGGRFQLSYIIKHINRIICINGKMKREFLDIGTDDKKIVLVRNGVKVEPVNRSYASCKNLLYMGRLTKVKNVDVLVKAFIKVIDIYNDLTLYIVGDGSEKNKIKGLIKRYGMEKNIIMTGMVDNPEDYLRGADLFISPSLSEGISNSLIEAMSLKLPCITSNIPGNVEVIGEDEDDYEIKKGGFTECRYGILFNPSDTEGLVSAMGYLLDDGEVRKKIGENAYQRIKEEFDLKKVTDNYIRLYNEVLKL